MNTQDNKDREIGTFALFKGPSGAGKTVGALSYPTPFLADFDKKMPAIARKHFPHKSIEYEQYNDIFTYCDQLTSWINGSCPYETVINDSITSMVSLILKSIGMAKGEGMEQMMKNMRNAMGKFKQDLMSIDYYNAETRIMEHIIEAHKILFARPENPRNIIFVAHILTTESAPDLKTKLVTKTRSIVTAGRKVAAWIPTQFDEVYLFGTSEDYETQKVKHMMTSETSGEDDAKTAFHLSQFTDFTNNNLYDLLIQQRAGADLFE